MPEQPSPGTGLPSSQVSPGSTTPSPQVLTGASGGSTGVETSGVIGAASLPMMMMLPPVAPAAPPRSALPAEPPLFGEPPSCVVGPGGLPPPQAANKMASVEDARMREKRRVQNKIGSSVRVMRLAQHFIIACALSYAQS